MRLVAYFALMTYCLVSKTEKLMVRKYDYVRMIDSNNTQMK